MRCWPTRSPGAAHDSPDAGPAERLAFVLHDTFALRFDEIASILVRSRANLAHRPDRDTSVPGGRRTSSLTVMNWLPRSSPSQSSVARAPVGCRNIARSTASAIA